MSQNPDDLRVLDALGRSVPQVSPPAELRARVLAAATQTAATQPVATGDATERRGEISPHEQEGEPPSDEQTRHVHGIPAHTLAPAPASRWPWGLAAAAAIVAAVTSVGWLSARGEIARLQTALADARANATKLLAVRDEFERERSRYQHAAAILGASDVTYTALAGVAPVEQARGRVYVSPTRGLLFAAEDLPALPPNRSYQLWTIVGGKPVSHGVFELDTNGAAQLLADAAPGMAEAYAVTVEPLGGVPEPTGPKVLLGTPLS